MSLIGFGPPESVINVGSGISGAVTASTVAQTIISTETVTQTGLLTSSVVSTNSPQTGAISSSIPTSSATATTSNSSDGPYFPHGSSSPRYSRFHSLQLGPIVGGVVAVVALILIFIYLLLRHRASQREIRLRAAAEIDPTPTPFDPVDTREGLGRHVSINDGGSEMPTRTVRSSQSLPPVNISLKRARTNYTVHSSIHDERLHLNSNSSHDLITNGVITEEMTHTLTYTPSQSLNETHLQTDLTNNSTDSDYAPPAYDSLPTRNSRVISSQPNLEPSIPV